MEGINIRLLRFSVPPVLFVGFIFWAGVLKYGSFQNLIEKIYPISLQESEFLSILLGGGAIIAFGFIISGIPVALWRVLEFIRWDNIRWVREWLPISATKPYWTEDDKDALSNHFKFNSKKPEQLKPVEEEIAEWKVQGNQAGYIQQKIARRWEMFIINTNSASALFLALILGSCLAYDSEGFFWWLAILAALLTIFIINRRGAMLDIDQINHFLLANPDPTKTGK